MEVFRLPGPDPGGGKAGSSLPEAKVASSVVKGGGQPAMLRRHA